MNTCARCNHSSQDHLENSDYSCSGITRKGARCGCPKYAARAARPTGNSFARKRDELLDRNLTESSAKPASRLPADDTFLALLTYLTFLKLVKGIDNAK